MGSATNSIYEARCSGADLIASGTLIPLDDEETEISIPTGSADRLVPRQQCLDGSAGYLAAINISNRGPITSQQFPVVIQRISLS